MSYSRTSESTPKSGSTAVTVCTHDLAFFYFLEDELPSLVPEDRADAELLVPEVVEFQDYRVGLTALDARMRSEKPEQPPEPFFGDLAVSL